MSTIICGRINQYSRQIPECSPIIDEAFVIQAMVTSVMQRVKYIF